MISPVLNEIDQAAVWAFYGRQPSTQSDVGYPVITIPVVLVGSSERPRNLILNIPFMIRIKSITGRRIITDIYKVSMQRDTVTNTFIDIPGTKATIYSVRLQNP